MDVVEKGTGSPIVVVPSLQGRWEFLAPTIDALARSHRVITFSLAPARDLDALVNQVEEALDQKALERAAILGISFGGRVALRFAATHPARTSALVMASVPRPHFRMRPSHRFYARYPRLFAPLFFAAMPGRLWTEVKCAMPDVKSRVAFLRRQAKTLLRAPLSPSQVGARALLIDGGDPSGDCARVVAPTLVVTGERALDFVVPRDGTIEYANLIAGARAVTLEGTGHLGSLTKPQAFANVVREFLEDVAAGTQPAR